MAVHVFGIRHHGPGCARSLRAALEQLEPDAVLIEGPPEAESVLSWALDEAMRPPVALLVYPTDAPRRGVYFPLTSFSPEWQALRFALERQLPLRMMDLPQAHCFGLEDRSQDPAAEAQPPPPATESEASGTEEGGAEKVETQGADGPLPLWRDDPLALLAEAAGYSDHELWWEEQIERREDATDVFRAILEAMTAVRSVANLRPLDELREAYMRRTIRAAEKDGFVRIAVICGAFHAPVLAEMGPAAADNKLLKGLPKTPVTTTWIPWSHSRLAFRSGYGAGVSSPGWYHHLWNCPRQARTRWVTTAARLLREEDLDASSASVIEAVRLADALAALRELRSPGLAELNEAIQTVLCHGSGPPMQLIRERLEIGDVLGAVPAAAPAVPLVRDLEALQRTLRLKPSTEIRSLDLDLRNDNDRSRSRLLHRLRILSIPWGEPRSAAGTSSTFHELWKLQWQPDFAVAVIEASLWGNTVERAAAGAIVDQANKVAELPQLTHLVEQALVADLAEALGQLLEMVQTQAAVAADVRHLMEAVLPLAKVARYGDVRGTAASDTLPVCDRMIERVLIGLPGACSSLDDEAAERMLSSMQLFQQSLDLLAQQPQQETWYALIDRLARDRIHGLVRGWCCRLLMEKDRLGSEEQARIMRLELSPATPAADAASWLSGLLRGSGLLLVHQELLWEVLDGWLRELDETTFVELLPLLRRAFANFQSAERRAMGEKVARFRHGSPAAQRPALPIGEQRPLNRARADRVLPVLAKILGVTLDA